jgi:hypothetical protein
MEEKHHINVAFQEPKKAKRKRPTKFARMKAWAENHWFFATVMFLGLTLGGTIGLWKIFSEGKEIVNDIKSNIKHKRATYASIISSNPDAGKLLSIIKAYYSDVADDHFEAVKYFAPKVERYHLLKNQTHEQIDANFKQFVGEFVAPRFDLLDTAYSYSRDDDGNKILNFWVRFRCYRASKKLYEHCLSQVEFVFNPLDKILRMEEICQKDLKFSQNKE